MFELYFKEINVVTVPQEQEKRKSGRTGIGEARHELTRLFVEFSEEIMETWRMAEWEGLPAKEAAVTEPMGVGRWWQAGIQRWLPQLKAGGLGKWWWREQKQGSQQEGQVWQGNDAFQFATWVCNAIETCKERCLASRHGVPVNKYHQPN